MLTPLIRAHSHRRVLEHLANQPKGINNTQHFSKEGSGQVLLVLNPTYRTTHLVK
ncbi:hypothetical protein FRC06_010624, partial [Ceratobasidium sp. 370]